jgi:hypothetical protein
MRGSCLREDAAKPGLGQDHVKGALAAFSGSRGRPSPFSSIAYRKTSFVMVTVVDTIERSDTIVITGNPSPR